MDGVSRQHQLDLPFSTPTQNGLRVAGLFAGIGGVESGLAKAGHHSEILCEWDPSAQRVLRARFEGLPIAGDVRSLKSLPKIDLLSAGFPCQDLSQAGRTAGIRGERSGLVSEVFRLLDRAKPRWLLLENVPFMLQLERGEAMRYLTTELSSRGFNWAYRIVDTRAFGLPQRRRRVLLLASRKEDPRSVLFADDAGVVAARHAFRDDKLSLPKSIACGFYWTEGTRGLGWARNAVPTLKGGSGFGIPSPPAIVLPTRGVARIVTPNICDAERLQGFEENWTAPAVCESDKKGKSRWKLVGNAVSVPVFHWVGERLLAPVDYDPSHDEPVKQSWPSAAWSMNDKTMAASVSEWPKHQEAKPLHKFLEHEPRDLSLRAARGFYQRANRSSLRFPAGFMAAVKEHIVRMEVTEH